jgi:hypothetical protein
MLGYRDSTSLATFVSTQVAPSTIFHCLFASPSIPTRRRWKIQEHVLLASAGTRKLEFGKSLRSNQKTPMHDAVVILGVALYRYWATEKFACIKSWCIEERKYAVSSIDSEYVRIPFVNSLTEMPGHYFSKIRRVGENRMGLEVVCAFAASTPECYPVLVEAESMASRR